VDEKLVMIQQYTLAAQQTKHLLGCIKSNVASRSREGILPVCPVLVRPPPGVLRPALEPSAQDRPGPVGGGPEEATAMIRGREHLCCEERLRAAFLQPGEEKALGRPYCSLSVFEGG